MSSRVIPRLFEHEWHRSPRKQLRSFWAVQSGETSENGHEIPTICTHWFGWKWCSLVRMTGCWMLLCDQEDRLSQPLCTSLQRLETSSTIVGAHHTLYHFLVEDWATDRIDWTFLDTDNHTCGYHDYFEIDRFHFSLISFVMLDSNSSMIDTDHENICQYFHVSVLINIPLVQLERCLNKRKRG